MTDLRRRPAVFLDRDGTVIHDRAYLATVEGVDLLPRAAEGLRAMADLGYLLVLVTNQSGVARGYFGAGVVEAQYARLQQLLAPSGVQFAAMRMCPHGPADGCRCRKPLPGMLLDAAAELAIDCQASWMIGDKESDTQAGRAAGCRTIRLGAETDAAADFLAPDLVQAASLIRRHGVPGRTGKQG